MVDTAARNVVAFVTFTGSVQEIFAVSVLPWRYPALLELSDPLIRSSFSVPDATVHAFAKPDPLADRLAAATAAHVRREFDRAIDGYRAVLAERPTHTLARFQLGLALTDAERWSEAVTEMSAVVAEQPRNAEAHNSLGLAFARQSNEVKALEHFDQAIAADHQFALAHFNRGLVLLRLGNFAQGWEGYEWRWQMPGFIPFRCPQPQWRGADIGDKVLLVHTEQGSGDALQFARCLPLAARRCRKLMLVCTENLKALMSSVEGVAEVHPPGDLPTGSFDVYCPLLSLPRALGITLDGTITHRILGFLDKWMALTPARCASSWNIARACWRSPLFEELRPPKAHSFPRRSGVPLRLGDAGYCWSAGSRRAGTRALPCR